MEEPQSKFFNIIFIAVIIAVATALIYVGITSRRGKEMPHNNGRIKSEEELLLEAKAQTESYQGPKYEEEKLIEDANKITSEYEGPKYSREELLRQAEEMSRAFKEGN